MPIYEYRCQNCNHVFEELIFSSLTKDEEIICPKCNQNTAEKMMSAFSSTGTAFENTGSCGSSGFG